MSLTYYDSYKPQLSRTSVEYRCSPKNPKYFKKRVCIKYVNNPKTNLCSGCQKVKEAHAQTLDGEKWNYKLCTILEKTDAYSQSKRIVKFNGFNTKNAKYIRVENETNPKDMVEYLLNPEKDGWGLQRPHLIISVTGGAGKFTIPHRMKEAFKSGLIKAAATTGAWIISGGTNTGVMKLVGEAVASELHKYNTPLTVLGIATWGKIKNRELLVNPEANLLMARGYAAENSSNQDKEICYPKDNVINEEEAPSIPMLRRVSVSAPTEDPELDPNHNHFILVDDGSDSQFGKEIEFRAKLENELRKGKSLKYYENRRSKRRSRLSGGAESSGEEDQNENDEDDDEQNETEELKSGLNKDFVPMILIVVQGGPNTLFTVEQSLKQNVPVIVFADSKGCADLIANACSLTKPNAEAIKKLLDDSGMFEKIKNTPAYEKETSEAIKKLDFIISKIKENLINVFRIDSEEGVVGQDIGLAILRAFLNSRKKRYYDNLKLAIQWNSVDIAKSDIFTGEEEFKPNQLNNLMEIALVENKPKFVKLLLENGLNLKTFLTYRRLIFLYNSQKIRQLAKKSPLFQLFKRKYYIRKHMPLVNFKGLQEFLKDVLFEDFNSEFLNKLTEKDKNWNETLQFLKSADKKETTDIIWKKNKDFGYEKVEFPEQNLFLWALLMNRIDIAKLFWQTGEHQICNSLFASSLMKSLSEHLSEIETELTHCAEEFEEMACGVLNIFDSFSNDIINGVILLQNIPYYNLNCLEMAVEAKCLKFISLPTVQNLLTDIWNGKIVFKSGFRGGIAFSLSCLSLGFLAPFFFAERKANLNEKSTYLYNLEKLKISKSENFQASFRRYNGNLDAHKVNILKYYFLNEDSLSDTREPKSLIPNIFKCFKSKKAENEDGLDDNHDENENDEDEEEEENFNDEDEKSVPRVLGSYRNSIKATATDDNQIEIEITEMNNVDNNTNNINNNNNAIVENKKPKMKSRFTVYWNRYNSFVQSPRVHFVYDAIFYTIFLLLFSYLLLCDFNYYSVIFEEAPRSTNDSFISIITNRTNETLDNLVDFKKVINWPSVLECIIIFWIYSFFLEEINQFFFSESDSKFRSRLVKYFDNNWNYLDLTGIFIFTIGFILRLISTIYNSENLFTAARVLYAIDLSLWYVRLLHVSIIFKSLGPKLVMIQKMLYDLLFFLIILTIFICSFGITTQATLYPGNAFDINLFRNLVNKAYWPIYGEMKILEEITEEKKCTVEDPCPETAGIYYSYIALMIYMVVGNVLLLNLLIAMFSSTFQDVQDNTDQIWKFQRYRLVFEYHDSSIFPAPINLISYMISIGKYIKRKNSSNEENTINKQEDELFLERKFAEEFVRTKNKNEKETSDYLLKNNSKRLELLESKLNEIIDKRSKEANELKFSLNWIMTQMSKIDSNETERPPFNRLNSKT